MSDYNFLMESRLSPEQLQVLNFLSRVAGAQGLNFYLVGGAVRDLVHGQQLIRDFDFTVEGNLQKILRQLESTVAGGQAREPSAAASPGVEEIALDKRLDVAEVRFRNGVRGEIAASRNEIYSKPGRPPEILPAMIFDDLKRRDFSANAMAISLHPNSRGLLLDPTNGSADIAQRELRVLHNRSFAEDPVRIYRILRLGLRLEFKPEERTARLLESAIENRLWEEMSPEQQGLELRAILEEENPARVLKMFSERRLLGGLDRKLGSAKIAYERFAKVRAAARTLPGVDAFLLNFNCLVEKLGSADRTRLAEKILRRSSAIKAGLNLERDARRLAQALSSSKSAKNSYVLTLLSEVPQYLLLYLLVYHPQAKVQARLKNFLFKFPQLRAKLPRAELKAIGMPPGPKFEAVLERVFLDQLDGKIRTPAQMTNQLRALSGIKEAVAAAAAGPKARARRTQQKAEPARVKKKLKSAR